MSLGPASVGDTIFDFDDTVVASPAYQRAIQRSSSHSQSGSKLQSVAGHRNPSAFIDEGYGTGVANTPNASIPSRSSSMQPHEAVVPDFGRRKSVSFKSGILQTNQGNVRRWQSHSTSPSLGTRSSGSRREKIRSMLRRLSTSGSASPITTSLTIGSPDTRRNRCRDFNISIDLKTTEGASAPLIVKVAQTGSRVDVERLIQSNHDIEARHIHSRRNALLVAAHCGNEEVMDLLIQNNARLEVADGAGCTALHLAASRGHIGVLGLLLLENVDIEARNFSGRTALWLAAEQGQLDAARILVATHAKVNSRANNQMTALHVAARQGYAEVVELLISQGADSEAKDALMMTALHYACEEGHPGVIELLFNNKIDINVSGSDRRTPLICAAAMGRFPVVQLLLKKKASSRSADDAGMTAIHWAAFNGHAEVVDLLSQKKGSLAMTKIAGRTALHLAVMNSQFAVVELLLRRDDVSLEARCESGLTPLHYACIADSSEIAKLLLVTGSDIEAQADGDQRTPVHIAVARSSMGLLNLLCDKGASLDARDSMGDRALCVACRQGRASAVQNLLSRGSPLYLRLGNRLYEDSPLCLAAMGGHLPIVSLLLQHGASVLRGDETGWQPARYAAYYGHPEVLQLLLVNSPTPIDNSGFGLSAEEIGFAPHATIPEDRKRKVRILLNRRHPHPHGHPTATTGSTLMSVPRPSPRSTPISPFEPTRTKEPSIALPSQPQELPGTLEQGLPDSRSVTPDQMRRDMRQPDTQGPVGVQQILPTVNEQALIQQPRAVNASVEPWDDMIQSQATAEESSGVRPDRNITIPGRELSLPQVSASASASEHRTAEGTQDMSRRLLSLLYSHSIESNDDNASETSSVSVYTAPEGNDPLPEAYELPG